MIYSALAVLALAVSIRAAALQPEARFPTPSGAAGNRCGLVCPDVNPDVLQTSGPADLRGIDLGSDTLCQYRGFRFYPPSEGTIACRYSLGDEGGAIVGANGAGSNAVCVTGVPDECVESFPGTRSGNLGTYRRTTGTDVPDAVSGDVRFSASPTPYRKCYYHFQRNPSETEGNIRCYYSDVDGLLSTTRTNSANCAAEAPTRCGLARRGDTKLQQKIQARQWTFQGAPMEES